MPMIQVDEQTAEKLEFAARMQGTTAGKVVSRLVHDFMAPPTTSDSGQTATVYALYAGHKTTGAFDRETKRLDVTSGPLKGQSFKTPTGAARAIVAHYNPAVSPHRNGWSFWLLEDGSGKPLQSIRH